MWIVIMFIVFVIEVLTIKSFTVEPKYIIVYDSFWFGVIKLHKNELSETEVDEMVLWMNKLFSGCRYRKELVYAPGLDTVLRFKVLDHKLFGLMADEDNKLWLMNQSDWWPGLEY